jgi:DNA polymerase-3 subunit epsilon
LLDFLRLAGQTVDHATLATVVHAILKSSSLPAGVEKTMLDGLPEAPGVYFFYGKEGELLYVGKSVNIKDRVRSHFSSDQSSAKEMTMCQQVQRVDHRETAGELGALLLESRLIKELRPLFNAMARRKRKLIVARRVTDRKGYYRVSLEETDFIEARNIAPILAVFKHQKQAEEYLSEIAKTHRLCHKLLGLEQGRSYCFYYHLKQCRGACAGEEDPLAYNLRLEEAFGERRVKAWPFEGGIAIEEKSIEGTRGEVFLVDNWCLVSSFRYSEFGIEDRVQGSHRFDYDSYKILSRYLMNSSHRRHIRQLRREQFEELLSSVVSEPE